MLQKELEMEACLVAVATDGKTVTLTNVVDAADLSITLWEEEGDAIATIGPVASGHSCDFEVEPQCCYYYTALWLDGSGRFHSSRSIWTGRHRG